VNTGGAGARRMISRSTAAFSGLGPRNQPGISSRTADFNPRDA
jgi:hypothetical protein